MRQGLVVMGVLLAGIAHAGSGTLRVGSQVLVVGDSATRVTELLGKPTHKAHASGSGARASGKKKGRRAASSSGDGGERWQYRQGNRVVSITLADGKVTSIRDDGG